MTKKIQKSMLLLVLISVLLFGVGASFVFYDTGKNEAMQTVKNQAVIIQSNYNNIESSEDILNLNSVVTQSRISVIDESGTVIFDNKSALDKLDNHNDRQEVIEARANGVGEEERYSNSLLDMYYYYAVELDNGLILRISTSINSFLSLIYLMLPFTFGALIVIFLIAIYISKKLTHNIVEPIEKADLKSNLVSPYVELDVYFNALREQKSEIERQMIRVNRRKETINTILNTMQEGFMIVDEEQNVFLANQAFLQIVGINNYEVDESVYRFINDRKLLLKIEEALTGKSSSYKIDINDKTYQVYISHTRILEADVAILLFVDISMEYENQKHREQFSANVSHELKTPLTSIKGLSELLSNNMVDEKDIPEFGAKIQKQSERLLELIDHIIRLSKFDEDGIEAQHEHFKLKPLVDEVLEHMDEEVREKQIKVELDVDDISMYGNYQMIDELLFNLIDNAVKYNYDSGWLKVKIKEENGIFIEVSNAGRRIPKEGLSRIFERFYRVDEARDKKSGGTGLGLSIVKHIVMYHDGTVDVYSEDYTSFSVHLPQ